MTQVRLFFTVFLLTLAFTASAQESMIEIDIERNGASIPAYVMRHPQAVATLVLLPGGDAGSGKIINGKPASGNFLSRSRDFFQTEGFNVVVAFRPIVAELAKASTKKFILIEGGAHPEGDVCSARHWHGFINFEKEAVQAITTWIKSPQN
jgi:hypothetical protein